MMQVSRDHAAVLAAALALGAAPPALADSTSFVLTTTWQKIASAGTSVDVQNNNGTGFAVLSTAATGTPSGTAGQALGPGEHRLYTLNANLYAIGTVPIVVMSGLVGGGPSGSTGTDASANLPATPNVGAAFGAGGPYAGYLLVKTVAASPTRLNIEVENDSGAQIVLVRDDGTATAGTAPANATVWSLGGSSLGVGYQGGGYSSTTFKGRLQIYAPAATAQVAVKLD